MTLGEVKKELREKIRTYKDFLKDKKKPESGIDTRGYQHRSSDYEMIQEIKIQLAQCEEICRMLKGVKRLK